MAQPTQPGLPQLRWDKDSGQWHWYDEQADTINFLDGLRIQRPGNIPRTSLMSPNSPVLSASAHFSGGSRPSGYSGNSTSSQSESQVQFTPHATQSPSSAGPISPQQQGQLGSNRRPSVSVGNAARDHGQTHLQPAAAYLEYRSESQQPRVTDTNGQRVTYVQDPRSLRTVYQSQPADGIVDPILRSSRITGHRYLHSADQSEPEQLFPEFGIREQPKKFFTVGKVFLVLWV
jgi:hypothetical protein